MIYMPRYTEQFESLDRILFDDFDANDNVESPPEQLQSLDIHGFWGDQANDMKLARVDFFGRRWGRGV
jgi:hypothetical protein